MKKTLFSILLASALILLSTGQSAHAQGDEENYQQIEWVDLIPEDDLDALLNPPESLMGIEDGSSQDSIDSLDALEESDPESSRFYAALKSARVVETYDNKMVKIPGFMVPLTVNEDNKVTEFFIVPYFGACLHMPPPPPNQMVFAKYEPGYALETLYQPFWFEGQLQISMVERDLGSSAYTIDLENLYEYEE